MCVAYWGNVRQASVCVRQLVSVNTVFKVFLLFVYLLLVFLRQIETVSAHQNVCLCIVNWAVRDCQDKCLCLARDHARTSVCVQPIHTRTSICGQPESIPGRLVFVFIKRPCQD